MGIAFRHGLLAALALACAREARASDTSKSSFLFVPYPITEPALGNGLLAGPVWMRPGPQDAGGRSEPQAFGAGALWTSGGSRGVAAFDRRAWNGGRWQSTALAFRADLRLAYDGLSPGDAQDRGFDLRLHGFSVEAERRLGAGAHRLSARAFAVSTRVEFAAGLPVELPSGLSEEAVNGLALRWKHDTRDDLYTPARGHLASLGVTGYVPGLGASFSAQSWRGSFAAYRALPGRAGVLGVRVVAEAGSESLPFYLRPYVALRGVSALRYAGERVVDGEVEWRLPVGERLDLLAFGGAGRARSTRALGEGDTTVHAVGLGFRFTAKKYYGLCFGLDVARGPDGTASYIQIGNAWSR